MLEHYHQPLLSPPEFLRRILRSVIAALALLASTILIGTTVLHFLERFSWIDAFLNSVLIMTGLGLVNALTTAGGKLFTAIYALFSALAFYATIAIMLTPLLHRLLHRLHLDTKEK